MRVQGVLAAVDAGRERGGTARRRDRQRVYSYDTGPPSWIYAAPAVADGVIITGNTAGTIYAFALPATLPSPPPPDPNCPSGYTCQDIGTPAPAGTESVSGGVWKVTAGGPASPIQGRPISSG